MLFGNSASFLYIVVFVIIYNLATVLLKNKKVSNIILIIGSLIILSNIVSYATLVILILISSLVFYSGKFLNRTKGNRKKYLTLFVSTLIALFIIKNYKIVEFDLLQRIGLSYILFRLIHFLIESSKNTIKNYNIISFLNYIIFFPSFIAGPIDDYNNFEYYIQQNHDNYKLALFKIGLFKLMTGVIKKFFLVPIIVNYALDFSLFEGDLIWQYGFMISLLLYSFYILLDFSGYTDIAIGTAYLIGIKTPENFDMPYLATNLSNFWKKWHMTFSNFLFKYIFKPVVIYLSTQFNKSPRLLISALGYIITFIICGIWHGTALNFLYWGLWHAFGLILFKLWHVYIYKKRLSSKSSLFLKLYSASAVITTFSFVTIGWFFFNYQTGAIHIIASEISNFDSKQINVSTIKHKNRPYLKIEYEPTSKSIKWIDIYIKSSETGKSQTFKKVKLSKDHNYYIGVSKTKKQLYQVKVRPSSVNNDQKWVSTLSYLDEKNFEQSDLQIALFGEKPQIEQFDEISDNCILIEQMDLSADHLNQKITASSEFIDGYGWSILIKYLPSQEFSLDIEYKNEDSEWITYQEKRDGIYDFAHIHGTLPFNNTFNNLSPGKYDIRIKYLNDIQYSIYFTTTVTIPEYVEQ